MKTITHKEMCKRILLEGWPNPFRRTVFLCSVIELPFVALRELAKMLIKLIAKVLLICILPLAAWIGVWYLKASKKIN